MKISCSDDIYKIIIEYPETELTINAKNLIDCKKYFIKMLSSTFDNSLNELDGTRELIKMIGEKENL